MAKQRGRHWLRIGIYRSNIIGQNGFMPPIPNMQACGLYPQKDEALPMEERKRGWIQRATPRSNGQQDKEMEATSPHASQKTIIKDLGPSFTTGCGKYYSRQYSVIQPNQLRQPHALEKRFQYSNQTELTDTHFPFHPETYDQSMTESLSWHKGAIGNIFHSMPSETCATEPISDHFPWQSQCRKSLSNSKLSSSPYAYSADAL